MLNALQWKVWHRFTQAHTRLYRLSGGRVGGTFRGAPVLLPETRVEVGSEKRQVHARQASAQEKARLWPRLVEMYAPYADYQKRTSREIPVAILERTG